MLIILGEGRNDAIFFEQLIKRIKGSSETKLRHKLYPGDNVDGMKKIILSNKESKNYKIFIFGDRGKKKLVPKYLYNILRVVMNEISGISQIVFIRDQDSDGDIHKIREKLIDELKEQIKNYQRKPKLSFNNEKVVVKRKKSTIYVYIFIIPLSLERIIVEKYSQKYSIKIPKEMDPHDALNLIEKEKSKSREEIIKEAEILMKEYEWYKEIEDTIKNIIQYMEKNGSE